MRQHDADESVRYEVVMAIVTTARKDFEVVSDSEDLLEFVKERTLDKKVILSLISHSFIIVLAYLSTIIYIFSVQNTKRGNVWPGYDI